jgi:putative serine protease PepD
MAITIALLIATCALSVLSFLKVNDLEKKLQAETAARASTADRITIMEGAQKNLLDQQQALQGKFDAQAAADPTVIASQVQGSVYTVSTGNALGSAWVASSDHITAKFVTNYHVIADAWERGVKTVQVFQDKGQVYDGTIEQALPDVDLALIDVTADIPKLKQSSETPRPGQTIVVIGSPLGFGGSVSTGTVSALREEEGLNYIQFAAPISPGNSGGPIVNSLGEVIGITELDFGRVVQGAENAKFAIPVNQVCIRLQVC